MSMAEIEGAYVQIVMGLYGLSCEAFSKAGCYCHLFFLLQFCKDTDIENTASYAVAAEEQYFQR